MSTDTKSIADFLGPWVEPDFNSGLIARCRAAWNKPLRDLSREELATLLRQRFAVEHLLPIARKKLLETDDETEIYEGELAKAVKDSSGAA